MRLPSCSVCQNRYNEDERCPLLLQCGHGFCKECLSRMFSASPDTSLSCPRCRHVSTVGNSVTALKKNYAILALINDSLLANNYFSEEEDEEEDEEEEGKEFLHSNNNEVDDDVARRQRRGAHAATSCGGGGGGGGGSGRIEVGVHQGVKLLRRIADENESKRADGVEVWGAMVVGSGGRCRHKVAVKKVPVGGEMDLVWVQGQLEGLRRASMWCRNVCAFHGAARMEDGSLGLVMDKCRGSVQTEMQRNEGRLTLEQILRSYFKFLDFCNGTLCLR